MSVQKATECYQLLWCLQHLWETMPSSKKCGRGSWILEHRYPQAENEMQESRAWGKTTVERKLAAHQNGVCWSLPAQSMRGRGEEELLGKGTKLLLKERLSLVVALPLVQPSSSLGPVQVHMTATATPAPASCLFLGFFGVFLCDSATKKQSIPS